MPPISASILTCSILETKLKVMVFCRGIACFLGYPIKYDPTLTDHHLLGIFLEVVLSYANSNCLWDFNATDLSTVFAPLLDYADLDTEVRSGRDCSDHPLTSLGLSSIAWMQKKLTFHEAFDMARGLDDLASTTVWVKWFEFIRYSELVHDKAHQLRDSTWYPWVRTRIIGMMMMRPMEPYVSEQQFFLTCCKLHEYLPANYNYKQRITEISWGRLKLPPKPMSLPSLVERRLPIVKGFVGSRTTDDINSRSWVSLDTSVPSDSQESLQLKHRPLPTNFTREMYAPHAVSSRMAELLEGSIPEARDANWTHNHVAYW